MLRCRSVPSLALLLTVAACAAPAPEAPATPPVDVAALKDTIQARDKEWSAAYLAGNAVGIANLYTEDAATLPPTGDWVRGREAIAKGMQAHFDTVTVTAREDIADEVIPAGDHVVEIGHYSWQGTTKAGNKPVGAAGRYMVVWRKEADGAWRLLRDIGNEAPAKP